MPHPLVSWSLYFVFCNMYFVFCILYAALREAPLPHNESGATQQQLFFSDENTKELSEDYISYQSVIRCIVFVYLCICVFVYCICKRSLGRLHLIRIRDLGQVATSCSAQFSAPFFLLFSFWQLFGAVGNHQKYKYEWSSNKSGRWERMKGYN